MFTSQVQGMASQLQGLLPDSVITALQQVFGNCAQELDHRGPVNISTYTQQPALELNNGAPGQDALKIDNGNVTIGPTGANNPNQVTVNDPTTFTGYTTFDSPATFNDDIRITSDLVLKYCVEGLGSTISRVQLSQSLAPGDIGDAQIINADGNAATSNASGMGGGKIKVKLPPCLNNLPDDVKDCLQAGTCGYAAYFSDTTVGGPAVDCASKVNRAAYWELISSYQIPQKGSISYVAKVCCATVNGVSTLVVCTETDSICAKVTKGSVDCGDGSCP